MTGLTLIRALRAIDPTMKIIAMSGITEEARRRALLALGVSDVLTNPFDGLLLLEAVSRKLTEVLPDSS